MSIIEKLPGLKRAADFAAAIPELEQELAAAEARHTNAVSKMQRAPFDRKAPDLAALRGEVRDAELQVEQLEGLIAEATQRLEAATASEQSDTVSAAMVEAVKDWKRVADLWDEYSAGIGAAQRAVTQMTTLVRTIDVANQVARDAGYPERQLRATGVKRALLTQLSEQLATMAKLSQAAPMRTLIKENRIVTGQFN